MKIQVTVLWVVTSCSDVKVGVCRKKESVKDTE
jgi:hypothetical protein